MSTLRLQQILSRAGVASRRKAETLIEEGRVKVNGEVVTTLGARADPARDVIEVDGVRVGAAQEPATLMLHKPDGVVTTLDDPQDRETVAQLVEGEPYRFVPVGRLDYHTEGLLLLSTDGDLVHRLLHPSYHVPKIYQVKVKGKMAPAALDRLRDGVELDDGPTRPTVVEVLEEDERHTWIEIVVTEGRNRLVRRMMDAVGHPALRVVRTEMATLDLDDLRPGQYRYLAPDELGAVYRTAGLATPAPCARAEELGVTVRGKARRGRGPRPGQATEPAPPAPRRRPPAKDGRSGAGGSPRRGAPHARRPSGRGGEGSRRAPEGAGGDGAGRARGQGPHRGGGGTPSGPRGRGAPRRGPGRPGPRRG